MGCPIALYEQRTHHLLCPCHQSTFDLADSGKVVFGNGIVDHPSQVGGWPELKALPAPADADGDGMPDAWEAAHGLDPRDPADRNDYEVRRKYTNLEVYLHTLTR